MTAQFFRVDGADQETGQDTYLVLQAGTQEQAEDLAREHGLLISTVREAQPEDWGGAVEENHESYHHHQASQYESSDQDASHQQTHHEEPPAWEPPAPAPAKPSKGKNRRAEAPPVTKPAPPPVNDPPPAAPVASPKPARIQHADAPPTQAPPDFPRSETVPYQSPSPPSSAPAVVLACAGSAVALGGVLSLVLALWPDNNVRNELTQLDYRLHSLNQTILGSTLIVSGLIIILVGVLYYLFPRERRTM